MRKKSTKQRSSYTPNSVFMCNAALTDEERAEVEKRKEAKAMEVAPKPKMDERDYNKSLFEVAPEMESIILPNNQVIVRLLLRPPTGSGLYLAKSASKLDLQDPDHIKFEIDQSHAAQALHRGVVVAIGDNCSEAYKKHLQIGSIVDIVMHANLNQFMLIVNKESVEFENYYSIPEQYIHYIWKTDPKGYRLGSTHSHQEETKEKTSTLIESV